MSKVTKSSPSNKNAKGGYDFIISSSFFSFFVSKTRKRIYINRLTNYLFRHTIMAKNRRLCNEKEYLFLGTVR
ncbi:MAG: hypothetical protein J5765_05110, partial [Clostridia bacterium]|nr:hypothetical protein [Clostridia bacterium]